MTLGPLLVDIAGPALDGEDREILRHPLVGGVILFTRNYENRAQLAALCESIHALRTPRLLIAVDHEGGRVQRFREGFTRLPAARRYGECFDRDEREGLARAEQGGWLMAAELAACGVDLSFAPVLDLDHGVSSVIGDRAFHRQPAATARLAQAWVRGMKRAGMAATGKHFPGHGGIAADSHTELPVDTRPYEDLRQRDLLPFERLIANNLPAVMMAHVVYPDVDEHPASFSRRWIQGELRGRLRFAGAVFCDDLCMAGAAVIGDHVARARAALEAGCDMLPVCNSRAAVTEVLDGLRATPDPASHARLIRLHGRPGQGDAALRQLPEWRDAAAALTALEPNPELQLGE